MQQGAVQNSPALAPRLTAIDGWVLLLFAAICAGLRVATLGDTNYHVDDMFYVLVGHRMHDGLIPYVDIWDRKPFGLFLIYYLIAGVSRAIWAYQIAAWCFTAATAFVIHRIALTWTTRQGAILAGLTYLLVTCSFDGVNGQAPMFYNLFIAAAALLTVRAFPALDRGRCGPRVWLALALCGAAITVKQTALFESLFLGGYSLFALRRAGVEARRLALIAAGFGLIGAASMLAIAATYAWIGHWTEFWHAMVLSNLNKHAVLGLIRLAAVGIMLFRFLVLGSIAAWALRSQIAERRTRQFLVGWLAAALAGFLSVPNFFTHYALPLLVPLCVIASFAFARRDYGRVLFVAIVCFHSILYVPGDFAYTRRSIAEMDSAARIVRQHDGGGGLLVYDGPPMLYALASKPLLSPLAFPHHLNHEIERDVSHLRTSDEMDRIIAGRPGVVVMSTRTRNFPANADSYRKITDYTRHNCRLVNVMKLHEMGEAYDFAFYGDCGRFRPR